MSTINLDDLIGDLDIIGDDEISGPAEDAELARMLVNQGIVGDLDIVGASPAAKKQLAAAMKRAAQLGFRKGQVSAQRGPQAVQRDDENYKVQTVFIPFVYQANGGIVPGQQEVELVGKTATPSKIVAIVCDDETVDDLGFRSLKFGMDDMFAGAGTMPMSLFRADSVLNKILERTRSQSTEFSMRVYNRSADGRLPWIGAVALGAK